MIDSARSKWEILRFVNAVRFEVQATNLKSAHSFLAEKEISSELT